MAKLKGHFIDAVGQENRRRRPIIFLDYEFSVYGPYVFLLRSRAHPDLVVFYLFDFSGLKK